MVRPLRNNKMTTGLSYTAPTAIEDSASPSTLQHSGACGDLLLLFMPSRGTKYFWIYGVPWHCHLSPLAGNTTIICKERDVVCPMLRVATSTHSLEGSKLFLDSERLQDCEWQQNGGTENHDRETSTWLFRMNHLIPSPPFTDGEWDQGSTNGWLAWGRTSCWCWNQDQGPWFSNSEVNRGFVDA